MLPCFWIFSDLGRRCAGVDLIGHRYADWIATYRDPRFAAATDRARVIVDDLAEAEPAAGRAAMRDAFRSACRYELRLFDDAWAAGAAAREPAPRGRLKGSARTSATTNEVSEADNHG